MQPLPSSQRFQRHLQKLVSMQEVQFGRPSLSMWRSVPFYAR